MKNIIIDNHLTHLKPLLEEIYTDFNTKGEILYSKRNEIRIFEYKGERYAVKSFRIPNIISRIIYSFFRQSKAERSFRYAKRVSELGVNTPNPVGYIEETRLGLLRKSYYVCLYQPYNETLGEIINSNKAHKNEILKAFVDFTYNKLHKKGIYHKDYSGGNILIEKLEGNQYRFSIIDLNRISFKKRISARKGIENLRRLSGNTNIDDLSTIGEEYARLSGDEWPKRTIFRLLYYTLRFEFYKMAKKHLKENFSTLL